MKVTSFGSTILFEIIPLIFGAAYSQLGSSQELSRGNLPLTKTVVYSVSEGMPLSVRGLKEIKKATQSLGFQLIIANDPISPMRFDEKVDISRIDAFGTPALRLHFPSVAVFMDGKSCGPVVAGYKPAARYKEIIKELTTPCLSEIRPSSSNLKLGGKASIIRETRLPHDYIGPYFKPIGNNLVSYYIGSSDSPLRYTTFLFNLKTRKEIQTPGSYDSVPTPDLLFTTVPEPLRFFSIDRLLSDPNHARGALPDFQDDSLTNEYQSVGLLKDGPKEKIYRVVEASGGSFGPMIFRDYSYNHETKVFTALGSTANLCPTQNFSLPLISKDGLFVSGREDNTGVSRIYKIGSSGNDCTVIYSLPVVTGKISFDFGAMRIGYIGYSDFANGPAKTAAYVTDLNTNITTKLLDQAPGEYLGFPDFLPNGHIMVFKENDKGHSFLDEIAIKE